MKNAFILFILLTFGSSSWSPFSAGETNIPSDSAVLVYKYDDKNIQKTLSKEESATLKQMLHNKSMTRDIPACGFDTNISIRFGEEIFLPALDGDSAIGTKNDDLYFYISESERKTMDTILKKYGATFPAL